jgi:uncharacterized lipoprotein YmbA
VLAACASAPLPVRYHTLLPPPGAPAHGPAAPVLRWELLPVTVHAQLDRPQWVLRAADGSLVVLEQERWIAPLADEMGDALQETLARRFGPPAAGSAGAWRVDVELQRLDSVPGRLARLDALWSLRAENARGLRCAARLEQAVSGGVDELAAAHRRSVAALGEQIAAALADLQAGRAASCPQN